MSLDSLYVVNGFLDAYYLQRAIMEKVLLRVRIQKYARDSSEIAFDAVRQEPVYMVMEVTGLCRKMQKAECGQLMMVSGRILTIRRSHLLASE